MTSHCRHCLGDCHGSCLLPGNTGRCIHHPVPRVPVRQWVRLMGTRRFWSRVLGVR
jgi:hypothetical protein